MPREKPSRQKERKTRGGAMPRPSPKVSVLMPFYDNGSEENRKLYSQALGGILKQTFRGFEIVMVVSGEKEFARKMARKDRRIRIYEFEQKPILGKSIPLKEKLHGIITARNMCLEKARGEYVAYADYDDISLPGRLAAQLRFMEGHPDVGVLGSAMIMIDSDGKEIGTRVVPQSDEEIRKHVLQFNPMPQPTVMARAAVIAKAGGYRAGEIPEDYDLWVRAAKISKLHSLREPLVKYRVHQGGGASNYVIELYFGSLRVKWRAMRLLKLPIRPKDVAVNLLQLLSLFFPNSIRRVVFERLRSRFVIGDGSG